MIRILPCVGAAVAAAAFAWPTPLPTTPPAPRPTVLWDGAPAASFRLAITPLDVTPDGEARVLVRALLYDANGGRTRSRHGTDFTWAATRGSVQWQTGPRFGGPAAIVSLRDRTPLDIRVVANRPSIGERSAHVDPGTMEFPSVVAAALGPHDVRIGWFPQARGAVHIARLDARNVPQAYATVAAPTSSWDDPDVVPGTAVRYRVARPGAADAVVRVVVPPALPQSSRAVVHGTGMWLAFSPDPRDDDGYTKLDVPQIVSTARRAGLRYVELRMAYGAFNEVTSSTRTTIDALIDGLSEAGIAVVGWTVPRANAFDDLAAAVAVADYQTPAGHRVAGLAVDLERGDEFLGAGDTAYVALREYLRALRHAVGPHVLLVATVEDPFLEALDPARYPYAAIAANADVLQPMAYWPMLAARTGTQGTQDAVAGSLTRLRALVPNGPPIIVGAQTSWIAPRGAPSAAEVARGIETARDAGAFGITFFDWTGTTPAQWDAISGAGRSHTNR